MFRFLGGFKKKIPPCLSIYSNERTKDRPLMPSFFTRNLFVPCIYIYTWKCNRRNICFTVLEIAHNVWELQFLFPRMLSRSSELTMLIMNWNWLNSLYPIQVSIDFDTLLNEIGEIRLGFSYQQSVTLWSSLGNQKINSIHFIFFSKCIYIIYLDATENVAFTGVKIISSKRKVNTSLSLSTDSSWKTNALSSSLLSQFAPSINS